jgi:hypothetical protein
MWIYTCSWFSFTVNNHKKKKIEQFMLYTLRIYGLSNLYTDLLPNCHLFWKSTYYAGNKIFNNSLCRLTNLRNEKAQFKVALRRLWNTQTFESVGEFLIYYHYYYYYNYYIHDVSHLSTLHETIRIFLYCTSSAHFVLLWLISHHSHSDKILDQWNASSTGSTLINLMPNSCKSKIKSK